MVEAVDGVSYYYYTSRMVDAGRESTAFLGIIFLAALLWAIFASFMDVYYLVKHILVERKLNDILRVSWTCITWSNTFWWNVRH
jgi:hypothetical protein